MRTLALSKIDADLENVVHQKTSFQLFLNNVTIHISQESNVESNVNITCGNNALYGFGH
jgi:hypothetical protein